MNKQLLIIIPAYNESESIADVVSNLTENFPQFDYVIINDGSSDDTAAICRSHHFNIIDQSINLGLTGTFQTGVRYALRHGYDAVLQFDADGQHLPEYIQPMLDKLHEGYDIVIASRYLNQKKPNSLRMFGSRIISATTKMITGQTLTDPTSGMRIYGKRLLKIMASDPNITPEPDTVAYLMRNGAKTTEVPVVMKERLRGRSYLTVGKSIMYMATICTSNLFLCWFRPRLRLGDDAS